MMQRYMYKTVLCNTRYYNYLLIYANVLLMREIIFCEFIVFIALYND